MGLIMHLSPSIGLSIIRVGAVTRVRTMARAKVVTCGDSKRSLPALPITMIRNCIRFAQSQVARFWLPIF